MSERAGRLHLRVPVQAEAQVSWGYRRERCTVVEFSIGGLRLTSLSARTGTPVAIELQLPEGSFALCGVVVHHHRADNSVGVRFLDLSADLEGDLDSFLWELIAASALADSGTCSVVGCGRQRKARGMCSRHYNRWRREQRSGTQG